jgi:hypothetical protein
MQIVCAWCETVIDELPGRPGTVSHGICAPCATVQSILAEFMGEGDPALPLHSSNHGET